MDKGKLKEIITKHKDKDLELYYNTSKSLTLKSFKGELSSFSLADTQGMSARVLDSNKMGFSFTEELGDESIESMIGQAAANSKHLPEDKANAIYDSSEEYESDRFYNPAIDEVAIEKKKEFALKLEESALAYDKRIINVPHAAYSESRYSSIITNSKGLVKSQLANLCYSYLMVIASDGDDTATGYLDMTADSFEKLDIDFIVKATADLALNKLGAREVDSGKYRAIISEDCASSLLGAFFGGTSPFFAKNIQNDTSKLKGKLEQSIASSLITIIDDPAAFGLGRCEFDGEGVASQRMSVVEEGVLKNFFYNIYTANKDGVKSTGHGSRAGHKSKIGTSTTNIFLENGSDSRDALLSSLGSGVWIEEVEGVHAGINIVSGDFSLSAKGSIVEGGKIADSIKNFTISGNFFEILNRVVGVANDRRVNTLNSFSSPSLLLDELNISGK